MNRPLSILAATDFSAVARHAADRAARLAHETGAPLTLVHVLPGGAPLLRENRDGAEELCVLMEGDSFEVLDVTGDWAWGCLGVEGPVGYVRVGLLEPLIA